MHAPVWRRQIVKRLMNAPELATVRDCVRILRDGGPVLRVSRETVGQDLLWPRPSVPSAPPKEGTDLLCSLYFRQAFVTLSLAMIWPSSSSCWGQDTNSLKRYPSSSGLHTS